ncbi:MAG: hypothetical protein HOP18_20890 [Deltaproteobacteria bacterium]|nr:hypothetical protein [Deltaproteobacteria bacterium]
MTFIDLLKAKWTVYGLDAPIFAWTAAGTLVVWTLLILVWLLCFVFRESQTYRNATKKLQALKNEYTAGPRQGLSGAGYDALMQVFQRVPSLKLAWQNFNSQILGRRNNAGEEQFWASESAEVAFGDATVIAPRFNRNFHVAFPGILTGTGLLFTFLAILVALLEVRLVDNRVQGLELLIQGLSGKFVSSIAALLAATLFLLVEKPLFYHLTRSRQRLVAAIDDLVPRLSPAQILADLHQDISEQSTAFRAFNDALSLKLRQSFSESMGPTLERMLNTIDDLNQLLRASEAQKQDSITGSLETLLRNLERSITNALEGMGTKFTETLSGTTMHQFDRVADSLGGTARLLENMNGQFQVTQSALNDLVQFAKDSTVEQMALGRTQVEELTAVLRGLMTQMNETAGSSVTRMAATLTTVVHDLSTKVSELGSQVSNTMLESASKTTGAAHAVVEQASAWSTRNAEQLSQLLDRHQEHLDQISDVRVTLDTVLGRFKEALGQYTTITTDLRQITSHVTTLAAAAAGTTQTMQNTQVSIERVANSMTSQVVYLAEANRAQEDAWKQIQTSMRQYEQVFHQVEQNASTLLTQIGQHLRDYSQITKTGYEDLTKIADEHFKTAVNRLGSSVNDLDEHLRDLTETLAKAQPTGGPDGRRR